MNRLIVILGATLLLNINAAYACEKHVVSDASKKLLKTVPSLATVECARDALKSITLGSAVEPKCYQMTPSELEQAKQIASEEETSQALKAVFTS